MDTSIFIGRTIVFKKGVLELEEYAEPGMRAEIVSISKDVGEVYRVGFDFTKFDAQNRPYESANYYDKSGSPTLTAREAGEYEEKSTYYLPVPDQWAAYFEVAELSPELDAIMAAFDAREDQEQTYPQWLEGKLVEVMKAGATLDVSPSGPANSK